MRPCWVVLAPAQRGLAKHAGDRTVVPGKGDYVAIIDDLAGGDEAIAAALSKRAPTYSLWLDNDFPRVKAFVKGKYAGEVRAYPDGVARHFGCTFPTCDRARPKVDLTPHKAPAARKGQRTIGRLTIPQWQHAMETDDWSYLIDGASKETCDQVLAALDDPKPAVRAVAITLVDGISIYSPDKQFATKALAKLRALGPEATKVHDDLVAAVERAAVRAEFPWILNFDPKKLKQAVALLDDKRPRVQIEIVQWWFGARDVPKAIRTSAAKKLRALRSSAADTVLRDSIDIALDKLGQSE